MPRVAKLGPCDIQRCDTIRDRRLRVCLSHARELVNGAFAALIRSRGRCEDDRPDHRCNGPLQCAHGFSRRYDGTGWDERNCFCLCQGAHLYYTKRDLEWREYMKRRMGLALYRELYWLALRPPAKVDWVALLTRFGLERYIPTGEVAGTGGN